MEQSERSPGRYRREAAALLLLLAVASIAFFQSYGRWMDPIIDVGRDLYIPEQLRHGARLYVSFSYLYPPLAPYLLALLTAVVGASLTSYAAIGVAVSAVVAATLYITGRELGCVLAGSAASFLFLALSFTGATSWGCNFLFPYAHAATLGLMFLLLLELQLLRHVAPAPARGHVALAIVFAVLATWLKLEFAIAASVLVIAAVVLRRLRWTDVIAYVAANLLIFALLDLWWFAEAPNWFRDNVLAPSLLTGAVARQFYREVTGLANLGANLRTSVEGFVLLVGVVVVLRSTERTWRRLQPAEIVDGNSRRLKPAPRTVLLYAALGVFFLLLATGNRFFAAWTFAQVLLIPFALRDRHSPLPLLLLTSLLMSSRIFFRISPEWYGFVYIVPLYLLIGYVLFSYLPERGVYSSSAARIWLILILLIGARGLLHQNAMYSAKSAAVETQRGSYYDLPHRAEVMRAFLRWSETRGDVRTLVGFPEGLTLNYFTRKPSTISRHTFTPAEMPDAAAEQEAIRELEASPPDAVALVSRNMSEFGFRGFGVDYGRDLARAIGDEYRPAARWQSGSFWIVVLMRRAPSPGASRHPLPEGEGRPD